MSDLRVVGGEWVLDDIPDADNLGWITVDIGDGSWTQSDPSGFLLSGASTFNDITKISCNAVTASSGDYSFRDGAAFTGPRFYKNLETTSGQRINSDDPFVVFFQMVIEEPSDKDKLALLIGFCEDPTSNTVNVIKYYGTQIDYSSTTAAAPGGGYAFSQSTNATKNSTFNANNKVVVNNIEAMGNRLGATPVINLNSSLAYLSERSVNIGFSLSSDTDMFLVVMAGTRGAVTISDSDIQAKLRYRVVKLSGLPL
jgi:hypothetical protein